MSILERSYVFEPLPSEKDLEVFRPPYTPEQFTEEEQKYLRPFFSNLDRPVFVVQHLPEEVIGALSSRYSRSTQSLRRLFLTEYVWPVVYPEQQRDWATLSKENQREKRHTREQILRWIDFLNKHGGIEPVVNTQRARNFFGRWLAEYGDDSIAEMGGVHLCLEGLSNIVVKEVEDKRIGISPLEKSSRYVSFANRRSDGGYQYIVPGEIIGTPLEVEYREVMNLLFKTYTGIAEPYLAYIKERYLQGGDETLTSFNNSRSAKRFDDIRDLLPFSTQTNVALAGNGRAFEDLINRLIDHPLGELRWWGKAIYQELAKTVPSFVSRVNTERGAQMQRYRRNLQIIRDDLASDFVRREGLLDFPRWVSLTSFTPDADIEILTLFLFSGSQRLPLFEVRKRVQEMGEGERAEKLAAILAERKFGKSDSERPEVRFRKVPRAFENAHFLFAIWARGGDYRDLQRHRQNTQERQRFTSRWGYDLEQEVKESPFGNEVKFALDRAMAIVTKLEKISPDVSQYAVPFACLQHWYMNLSAREIYWMVELRTGPQGRPHYREVCQQIAKLAMEASPAIFQGMMVDWNDYSLSRRESEKRIERKNTVINN